MKILGGCWRPAAGVNLTFLAAVCESNPQDCLFAVLVVLVNVVVE
jgi:hypothetical protein